MSQKILIVGAGFAGVWSALGAARVLDHHGKTADVEITLISPKPELVIRPRLHEPAPHEMSSAAAAVAGCGGRQIHRSRGRAYRYLQRTFRASADHRWPNHQRAL